MIDLIETKKCEHIYGFNYGRHDEREYFGTLPDCQYDVMFEYCSKCGERLGN